MIRVLVVDDDFMVARLHSALVEQVPGFTVAGAVHSGNDALAAVRELRPELVLLDMYLPDLPGLEVLRELRGGAAPEEGPDVLVVTAARDAETVRGAQRGGAVQYVIKPFEGALLQERLRLYAEHRAALAALKAPEQDDVDRLFADAGSAAGTGSGPAGDTTDRRTAAGAYSAGHQGRPTRLPKGLTEQTSELVRVTLEACPDSAGLSASECAERSGLSRVSARRYLEHFVSLGTARVTLRYGTTGRPERRYHRVGTPGASTDDDRITEKRVISTTDNP
ncbi:MAG TPA: response regulator [Streptomyces sp.]|nr:response regulator [Streptomyces sp.]